MTAANSAVMGGELRLLIDFCLLQKEDEAPLDTQYRPGVSSIVVTRYLPFAIGASNLAKDRRKPSPPRLGFFVGESQSSL
jgi:hypothetical protein